MLDPLPLYDGCPACGNTTVNPPDEYGDHAYLDCARCNEPVIRWYAYKQRAFAHAAQEIRRKASRR